VGGFHDRKGERIGELEGTRRDALVNREDARLASQWVAPAKGQFTVQACHERCTAGMGTRAENLFVPGSRGSACSINIISEADPFCPCALAFARNTSVDHNTTHDKSGLEHMEGVP
jgi:hypothetical protein